MYSFGRVNPYNPFIGGFIHEGVDKGTFKRFQKTTASIYSLEVNDEEYEKIQTTIRKFQEDEKTYKFNVIGLFAVALNLKIQKKDSFYCAEFVKYVLENAGIETNLPTIVRPDDFKNLENLKSEYKGVFREYKSNKIENKKNDFKKNLVNQGKNLNITNEIQINGIKEKEESDERE